MANLYWKNTTTTNIWNDVTNWFTEPEATNQAANVPWVAGDSTYLGYNLYRSTDSETIGDMVYIDVDIISDVTGICNIDSINGGGYGYLQINVGINIYGGTFIGQPLSNGIIHNATFTGTMGNNGTIKGGTFSGTSNAGIINGGVFTGTVDNANIINNGIFSGNIVNSAAIYGGIYSGAITLNTGTIYSGYWLEKGKIKIGNHIITGKNINPTYAQLITIKTNSDAIVSGFL